MKFYLKKLFTGLLMGYSRHVRLYGLRASHREVLASSCFSSISKYFDV